jgi:PKD repeat protein
MIKPAKISLLLFLLVPCLYYSCERIEPDEKQGSGDILQTTMSEEAIWLDGSMYTYLGTIDQRRIFEIQGSPDIPVKGDIVYYSDENNHISGMIEEVVRENSIVRFLISPAPLNDFFHTLALEFDLGDLEVDYYNYYPGTSLDGDTVIFGPLEFVWQNGGENSGIMNMDSLRYFSSLSGLHKYYMSPVWEGGTVARKIQMNYVEDIDISTSVRMVSKGMIDVADSLIIREGIAGPYSFKRFSVYFTLQEMMILNIDASDDNQFNFNYETRGRYVVESGFIAGKDWTVNHHYEEMGERSGEHEWDKSSSFTASFVFRRIITPVFCGNSGLSLTSEKSLLLNAGLEWPDWNYSLNANMFTKLTTGSELFSDLRDEELDFTPIENTILLESGQLENTAPVPKFSIEPGSGFTDTNFSFDASASSDKEDDVSDLQVRWDFNGDEVWDTNYSYSKQESHIYAAPGNYTVILEVLDSKGMSARLGKNLFVQAASSAPTAFFTVTPESGRTADLFTFDASGCWDAEDDVSLLKVRWDFDGDDIWDTQFATVKAASRFYPVAGTYVAKLEVKDTQGLTGSTSRIIEVEEANIKPTAFFTVVPEEGTINTNFFFDASGSSDPEDAIEDLRVRWDFQNDGTWDTEYRTIKTINHVFVVANTYTVVLQVIDTDDFSNTFSKTVIVKNPNTPPRADFTITPASGDATTLFTFDARISSDGEDSLEQLQFRWDWDNNDIWDTEFSFNPIVQRTFDETESFIVKLQVRDSGGLTHTKARLVIIE